MAEAALEIEKMDVPKGGIADFVMSDDEIEEVYGPDEDEGEEEYGTEGLGQFTEISNKMAAMGRNGDDTIAHVESGELIIPKAFLEKDPEMAETIFAYLESMGVKNPQRFVVGSEANSINPETGLPEFWNPFKPVKKVFKKATKTVKKIAKKVSKVVKPVVKIIQKVAPIVLPIALSMTPLGPVFGSALGSGIASLINGGSLKDAFKSALISGAMGAAGAGLKGMYSGQGFMEGVSGAISDPIGRFGQTVAGAQNSLSTLVGGAATAGTGAERFFQPYMTPGELSFKAGAGQTGMEGTVEQATSSGSLDAAKTAAPIDTFAEIAPSSTSTAPPVDTFAELTPAGAPTGAPLTQPSLSTFQAPELTSASDAISTPANVGSIPSAGTPTPGAPQQTFLDRAQEFVFPTGEADKLAAQTAAEQNMMNKLGVDSLQTASVGDKRIILEAGQKAFDAAGPSLLRQIAVPAAGAALVAYGAGAFDTPEQESPGLVEEEDGFERVESDPSNSMLRELGDRVLNPETGEYELVKNIDPRYANYASYSVPTEFTYDFLNTPSQPVSRPGGPFERPDVYSAEGGAIFPRRNGGIMPDEGIPGQDSVRAMLMPGEFVMTTDAVRGAGNGNIKNGIRNMYSVMRDLESRGRRTA